MSDDPTAQDERRGDVACSCGQRWYGVTRSEARRIGREHDDSPWTSHIVSSLLFIGDRDENETGRTT